MECLSAITTHVDAYEAGYELGSALAPSGPECLIIFSSIQYEPFEEFFDGLSDAFGTGKPLPVIFGGTGEGVIEGKRIANFGASALAINSHGKISFDIETESGVGEDSAGSALRAATRLKSRLRDRPLRTVMAMADFVADGVSLVQGLECLSVPIFGGLACDDRQQGRSYVFSNGKALRDAVGLLSFSGDFRFALATASGWNPIGVMGVVTEAHGLTVHKIDGISANEFMKQQLGRPTGEIDKGVIPLAVYPNPKQSNYFIRSPSKLTATTGEVQFYGQIETEAHVRVCLATVEDILSGADQVLKKLSNFQPKAIILCSCYGRKWLLGTRASEDVARLVGAPGMGVPTVGFPSSGEIGPLDSAESAPSSSYFHNTTLIAFCLGAG